MAQTAVDARGPFFREGALSPKAGNNAKVKSVEATKKTGKGLRAVAKGKTLHGPDNKVKSPRGRKRGASARVALEDPFEGPGGLDEGTEYLRVEMEGHSP